MQPRQPLTEGARSSAGSAVRRTPSTICLRQIVPLPVNGEDLHRVLGTANHPRVLARFTADLSALREADRYRQLAPRLGADFASNDYLGLAAAPELRDALAEALARGVPVGAAGSRLLRGNHPEHEALEAEAAAFFGSEAALYFGTGFGANMAIVTTLPDRGDLIVWDALSHASTREGLRLSRAETAEARHNDAGHVAALIAAWRARGGRGTPWIAVESVYSMEGDRAPLADLAEIARRHDAMLIVDEAHATGIYGEGRGLTRGLTAPHIALHTCGKALGASGALVTGPRAAIALLINRARGFIYATAPSPLMAAAVRASLKLVARPERRDRLATRVAHFADQLRRIALPATGTPIQPIILGTDRAAIDAAAALQAQGFDVRAIRPPTVPEGTARLRLSLSLNPSDAEVGALLDALEPLCA